MNRKREENKIFEKFYPYFVYCGKYGKCFLHLIMFSETICTYFFRSTTFFLVKVALENSAAPGAAKIHFLHLLLLLRCSNLLILIRGLHPVILILTEVQ